MKDYIPLPLPFTPGWDASGVVEAVGSGVTKFKKGDEVYARPDVAHNGNGGYAEYVAVKETETALKPKSVDHVHAAAIPVGAVTAWRALFDTAGLEQDQKILIHGAAGGVGSFAVQLAKWKGTHVIGTASSRNQLFLRELGVDEPIDYQKTRFEDVLHDVDVVLDTTIPDALPPEYVAELQKLLPNRVCGQPSCLPREVRRCWPNLRNSLIQGKSSQSFRRCCRCPKSDRLTNSTRQVTLAAK